MFVPGTREEEDRFGSALTTGDFDGDGIVDLAVAAAGEALGPDRGLTSQLEDTLFPVQLQQGAVSIVYGARDGPRAGPARVPDAQPRGPPDQRDRRLQRPVQRGDRRRRLQRRRGRRPRRLRARGLDDPISGLKGAVQVFPGQQAVGLGSVPPETFNRGTRNVPGVSREEEFGYTLAVGNLDGRSGDDLAIATQVPGRGRVRRGPVLDRHERPVAGARSQVWAASSPGVPGRASVNDRFGSALAVGRFGGPGPAQDLAIGAQNDGFGGRKHGTVTVLFGGPRGLTATNAMLLTSGWVGQRDGRATTSGPRCPRWPIRRAGFDDLLVGAPNQGIRRSTHRRRPGLCTSSRPDARDRG